MGACKACNGTGNVVCEICGGSQQKCSTCGGRGKVGGFLGMGGSLCSACEGKGITRCTTCDGKQKWPCISCDGTGKFILPSYQGRLEGFKDWFWEVCEERWDTDFEKLQSGMYARCNVCRADFTHQIPALTTARGRLPTCSCGSDRINFQEPVALVDAKTLLDIVEGMYALPILKEPPEHFRKKETEPREFLPALKWIANDLGQAMNQGKPFAMNNPDPSTLHVSAGPLAESLIARVDEGVFLVAYP